ncbi:MAG: hypothetical protein CL910_13810 [Deltaproteobacteria bacterium]|nr:hypothetical protein [Deltaproteobacteria bacterium]
MSDSTGRSVAQWLSEGLEQLAAGEPEKAAGLWRRVLEVEPGHPVALDYLASVGQTAPDDAEGGADAGPQPAELREEALELLSGGLIDEAFELLTTPTEGRAAELETLCLLELLRTYLYDDVLTRVGGGEAVPVVEMTAEDLMKFNLPSGAGFLISRIDGLTSVEDLVAVSGMDPFEAVHTLGRLLDVDIVGVAE